MFFILIVEPAHHRLTVIGCHRHEHVRVSSQGAKSRPSGHATYTKFLTDPSRNWNSADMRRRSSLAVFMSLLCRLADAEVLDPFCAPSRMPHRTCQAAVVHRKGCSGGPQLQSWHPFARPVRRFGRRSLDRLRRGFGLNVGQARSRRSRNLR